MPSGASTLPLPFDQAGAPAADRDAWRMPLQRFVALIGLFGAAFIVLVTALLAWNELGRLRSEAEVQAQSRAATLADHAGRLFEVSDVALRATTATIGRLGWDELARAERLRDSLRTTADALPYIEDIWLNDAEGELRLTSFAFPAPASNARDRIAFQLVRQPTEALQVGDLVVGRITGRRTFLVARRLQWPDGRFRGMVSATADLAYFGYYWQRQALPPGSRISLVRQGSLDVLAQQPAPAEGGEFRPVPAAARERLSAGDGSALVPTEDGVAAYRRVGDFPLLVGVELPAASVRQAWDRYLGTLLPFAAGALAALLGLVLLARRQGRREAAANRVVQQARAALTAANHDLEAAVAARTAELREVNEEIQRFAYVVSHDLRAPLVNVMGFTKELDVLGQEAFAAEAPPPARKAELAGEFEEALGFVRAGTAKMDRLLAHILKLAREGKRVLRPEPLDMTGFVRGLAEAIRYQVSEAGAAIEVGQLPALVADRLAVEQIFGNLLDNAVKYLDPARPGRIRVSGRLQGGYAVYEVADNGRGIAPNDHARVFELFRRAGKQDTAGEGIGLTHVKALVRSLGGSIAVTSQAGQGATFTVRLPQRPAADGGKG